MLGGFLFYSWAVTLLVIGLIVWTAFVTAVIWNMAEAAGVEKERRRRRDRSTSSLQQDPDDVEVATFRGTSGP